MKLTWLHLLAISLLMQPVYNYTNWKQISESPFKIKSIPLDGNPQNGPRQVSYSPDGFFLAVANAKDKFHLGPASGSVSMFSVDKITGAITELLHSPFKTEIVANDERTIGLAFSPSGTPTLTTANRFGVIKLFDFNTQTGELFNLRAANEDTCINATDTVVAYSPNGKHLATSPIFIGKQARVYQVDQINGDLTCLQEANIIGADPKAIAYYPVNSKISFLAVANSFFLNDKIIIFTANPETGIISNPKEFSLRDGQNSSPHWITFSPDGNFLAVAVADGVEVRKFRSTGINSPTLLPLKNSTSFFSTPSTIDKSGVRSVAYSPNGKWLAAANGNETISVFCVNQETGVLFNRQDLIVGHTNNLGSGNLTFSVIFSPDSKFLAVSNRDDNSISVFSNPNAGSPTYNIALNLSSTSSCALCTNN